MAAISSFANYLFGTAPVSSTPYTNEMNLLNSGATQFSGDAQGAIDSEKGVADNLWKTVNGSGPSVADTQLQQSLGQNLNAGLAMGSGASGSNSVLARYLASQATGNQGDQEAQAAAILRAHEVAQAQQELGQVYGNIGNQSAQLYGTNLQTGLGYGQTAAQTDTSNANREQSTSNALVGGLLSGIGTAAGGYFTGSALAKYLGSKAGGASTIDGSNNFGNSNDLISNDAWES